MLALAAVLAVTGLASQGPCPCAETHAPTCSCCERTSPVDGAGHCSDENPGASICCTCNLSGPAEQTPSCGPLCSSSRDDRSEFAAAFPTPSSEAESGSQTGGLPTLTQRAPAPAIGPPGGTRAPPAA